MDYWRSFAVLGVLVACAEPTLSIEQHGIAVREQGSMTASVRLGFAASRILTSRGEDGRGALITATDPVALDVTAERFGARALDPVLVVGGVQFVHYTFPSKGVMRYVAADAAMLVPGTEVSLQWGDDARTKVVLTRSLEVPK